MKLVYVGESFKMGGNCIKSVCPVHLVDRYGHMSGRGGADRNMSCVETGKRIICPKSVLTKLVRICQVWSSANDTE